MTINRILRDGGRETISGRRFFGRQFPRLAVAFALAAFAAPLIMGAA